MKGEKKRGWGEPYWVTFSIICAVKFVAAILANSPSHWLSRNQTEPHDLIVESNPNSRNFWKRNAEQQQEILKKEKKKTFPLITDEPSISFSPVMKWNWTSFLIHSWKPQCGFYQKQIWRPRGAPWVRLHSGPASSLRLICLVCLGRNHKRSGSMALLFVKKCTDLSFALLG